MLVYSDCFTKDEVMSDSYKQEAPFGEEKFKELAFEVPGRRVAKGNDDFGIAANVDEDAEEGATAEQGGSGGEQVVDIVDAFALEKVDMSKAEFKVYARGYIGHLVKYLTERKPDRVDAFKKGVQGLVMKVLEEWDTVEMYYSKNYLDFYGDNQALPVIGYYKGDEAAPRLIFIRDGLVEEKC